MNRAKLLSALNRISSLRVTGDHDDVTSVDDHRSTSSSSASSSTAPPGRLVSFGTVYNHHTRHESNESDEEEGNEEEDDRMTMDDIRPIVGHQASAGGREEDGEDDSDSEIVNDKHEVVLSLFWKGTKLGGAVYQGDTAEVFILADVPDLGPHYNVTKAFINQVAPTQIVTCGRLTESFVSMIKEFCSPESARNENGDAGNGRRCHLNFIPSNEFKHEFVKSRILAMRLPCEPEGSLKDDDSHLNYVHSLIDLNNDCSVYALGALLKFLDKNWSSLNLEARDQTVPVVAIKKITLSDLVSVDLETFTALQIFSGHMSPNDLAKSKPTVVAEGLSLFALFNRCKSTMGCKFLRMMMLKPTHNLEVLNERMDFIEFCNDPLNKPFMSQIMDHMRNVKGVLRILAKLKSAQPTVKDWKSLVKTIYHVVAIGEICSSKVKEAAIFQRISDSLTDDLYRIGQSINTIMDLEESEEAKRFVVRPGIDASVDRKKQEYNGMKELLSSVANKELNDLPEMISQCTVNYVPEMGYMLAIPLWSQNLTDEDVDLPNMQLLFISNGIAHYKTARCNELDKVLGDILTVIMEKEMEIMVRLIQFVEKKINCLDQIMELLAELDALVSIAAAAAENNYVRPTMTEDRVLEIVDGRHPLQELCVSDFVPNSIIASESEKRVKILTGPNACGKSVYLKQVALIVYMAHIGSFVPAESAKIGVLREIFTRIQTLESVSTRLSAFMIDLRQMALALQRSSDQALLVIDEFGKGTSELDGLALLAASLNHLLRRRQRCPLVLVSTHFHSVTDLLLDRDSPLLHKQTLDHLCNDKEVVYLHKLKDGGVTSSFAHQVAEAAGIDASIIARAREVMEAMRRNTLPRELPLSPELPRAGAGAEVERQRKNLAKFMTMSDDDVNRMDPEDYLELAKDI